MAFYGSISTDYKNVISEVFPIPLFKFDRQERSFVRIHSIPKTERVPNKRPTRPRTNGSSKGSKATEQPTAKIEDEKPGPEPFMLGDGKCK